MRSSAAVATSREGQRSPRSGRAGQHPRWGPAHLLGTWSDTAEGYVVKHHLICYARKGDRPRGSRKRDADREEWAKTGVELGRAGAGRRRQGESCEQRAGAVRAIKDTDRPSIIYSGVVE